MFLIFKTWEENSCWRFYQYVSKPLWSRGKKAIGTRNCAIKYFPEIVGRWQISSGRFWCSDCANSLFTQSTFNLINRKCGCWESYHVCAKLAARIRKVHSGFVARMSLLRQKTRGTRHMAWKVWILANVAGAVKRKWPDEFELSSQNLKIVN